jgi:hypothetical protein
MGATPGASRGGSPPPTARNARAEPVPSDPAPRAGVRRAAYGSGSLTFSLPATGSPSSVR